MLQGSILSLGALKALSGGNGQWLIFCGDQFRKLQNPSSGSWKAATDKARSDLILFPLRPSACEVCIDASSQVPFLDDEGHRRMWALTPFQDTTEPAQQPPVLDLSSASTNPEAATPASMSAAPPPGTNVLPSTVKEVHPHRHLAAFCCGFKSEFVGQIHARFARSAQGAAEQAPPAAALKMVCHCLLERPTCNVCGKGYLTMAAQGHMPMTTSQPKPEPTPVAPPAPLPCLQPPAASPPALPETPSPLPIQATPLPQPAQLPASEPPRHELAPLQPPSHMGQQVSAPPALPPAHMPMTEAPPAASKPAPAHMQHPPAPAPCPPPPLPSPTAPLFATAHPMQQSQPPMTQGATPKLAASVMGTALAQVPPKDPPTQAPFSLFGNMPPPATFGQPPMPFQSYPTLEQPTYTNPKPQAMQPVSGQMQSLQGTPSITPPQPSVRCWCGYPTSVCWTCGFGTGQVANHKSDRKVTHKIPKPLSNNKQSNRSILAGDQLAANAGAAGLVGLDTETSLLWD